MVVVVFVFEFGGKKIITMMWEKKAGQGTRGSGWVQESESQSQS